MHSLWKHQLTHSRSHNIHTYSQISSIYNVCTHTSTILTIRGIPSELQDEVLSYPPNSNFIKRNIALQLGDCQYRVLCVWVIRPSQLSCLSSSVSTRTQSALSCSVCEWFGPASWAASVAQLVEPSLEHRVLCLALCVSDSAQPAELPQ